MIRGFTNPEFPMQRLWLIGAITACLIGGASAQKVEFPREGKPAERAQKDPLEGKAPPALQVADWRNTDGKPLDWALLRGKVVLIDFWGTW